MESKKTAIRYFGEYVLLGEIARGGMGVVYHALQTTLDREVALKMIGSGPLASASAFRRFQIEAEAMAKLDHRHIVSIYEIGEHQDQAFLCMQLIDGASLAERRPDFALPNSPSAAPGAANTPGGRKVQLRQWQQEIAVLMAKVAEAIEYAHQRGVLHRDLKPGNILIDSRNEPHVTDFGLARLLHQEERLTQTQALMGTPAYMSPEQASGQGRALTAATDIFSLGAILYELLTGKTPFAGDSDALILQQIVGIEPPSPRALNPGVDRDLETICLRCLEKEPARRYRAAQELANDLNGYAHGQPIQARPVGQAERAWRWCRRHSTIAGLILGLLMAVALGAWGFVYESRRAREANTKERLMTEYVVQSEFSRAFADPEHIYPVSITVSVVSAEDPSLSGTLTEGDFLKMEPGQEALLKSGSDNTAVMMRVMSSQGDDAELAAGTRITVSMKNLRAIDNEFRVNLARNLEQHGSLGGSVRVPPVTHRKLTLPTAATQAIPRLHSE
jgi:tRNA A-37 threonylcarbamoyl transferase component Bud32